MNALSSRGRQILLAVAVIVLILAVVSAGVVFGRRLAGNASPTPAVVIAAPTAVEAPATAMPATPQQAQPAVQRVAVPDGRVENETGIAILPIVQLQGSRRYLLQVTSKTGALPFSGSYSRGSIDPKIAINPMTDIKGATPWEQEIQPPATNVRQWTMSVSLSTNPVGKNIQVQIWDIGPR
jgi:hypothetical protein